MTTSVMTGQGHSQGEPCKLLLHPLHAASLGFGSGCVPRLPGTAGSVAGVILYLPLRSMPWPAYLVLIAALFAIGVWLCGRTSRALGRHDHPAIVWDEIVGVLATLWLAPPGWPWILAGFALFRLFDIVKPRPIRWLDRQVGGGLGIMVDDLAAAVYAWISLQVIHIIYEVIAT